jgi:hypothetical protein
MMNCGAFLRKVRSLASVAFMKLVSLCIIENRLAEASQTVMDLMFGSV